MATVIGAREMRSIIGPSDPDVDHIATGPEDSTARKYSAVKTAGASGASRRTRAEHDARARADREVRGARLELQLGRHA
jgi:hypothetical protein